MIALSADTPDTGQMTVSELGITYPVLSDASRTYIRQYNVLHPQEGIARPSMFVVDREGLIRWRFVGMTASERPSIETVLEDCERFNEPVDWPSYSRQLQLLLSGNAFLTANTCAGRSPALAPALTKALPG